MLCSCQISAAVEICKLVRECLGLSMFNVDVAFQTAPGGACLTAHVLDVNYMPGFDKLEGFEVILTKWLRTAGDDSQKSK